MKAEQTTHEGLLKFIGAMEELFVTTTYDPHNYCIYACIPHSVNTGGYMRFFRSEIYKDPEGCIEAVAQEVCNSNSSPFLANTCDGKLPICSPFFGTQSLYTIPTEGEPGSFGFKRKHDTHTGVDIYVPEGTLVHAIEWGTVVGIEAFTGPNAEEPSPWWNDTKAVLVEGAHGVLVYGEIEPKSALRVGSTLIKGELLGTVLTVLKADKGLPTSMLHLELYSKGTRNTEWWRGERPANLLDPTDLLHNVLNLRRKD